MTRTIIGACLLAGTFALAACSEERRETPAVDEERENGEGAAAAPDSGARLNQPIEEAQEDLAQARADLERSTKARLERIDARIDELEKRTDRESQQLVADLKARRAAIASKLDEAKQATEQQWQQVENDLERMVNELEDALDRAAR